MRVALNLPPAYDGGILHFGALPAARGTHRHSELEFIYIAAGTMSYVVEGRRYNLQPRDLIWLFPGQNHGLLQTTKDMDFYVALFRPGLLQRACRTETARVLRQRKPTGMFCRRLPEPVATRLHQLLEETRQSGEDQDQFNANLHYLLHQAWQAFRATPEQTRGSELHPCVEKALAEIKRQHGDVAINEVARVAGLSYSRLSRLFKKQTGLTIIEFCNRQKVDRFREVYGTGQRFTILQAALEAGFGSYPTFHRVFHRITGLSPAAYRKQVRG